MRRSLFFAVLAFAVVMILAVMAVVGYMFVGGSDYAHLNVPDAVVVVKKDKVPLMSRIKHVKGFTPKTPKSVEEAVKLMEVSRTMNSQHALRQDWLVAEWLIDQPVDPAYHDRVGLALGQCFHESPPFEDEYFKALLVAFDRWGSSRHSHLFLSSEQWGAFRHHRQFVSSRLGQNETVPMILDMFEKYPSPALTEEMGQLLYTKHANAAERVLRQIGPEAAVGIAEHHQSESAVVAQSVESLYEEWGTDATEVRLKYYISITNDDSSHEAAKGWGLIAGVQPDDEHRPLVLEALQKFDKSERFNVESWLDACVVWGDLSLVEKVQGVFTQDWPFDREEALRFMLKYPDRSSLRLIVDAFLGDDGRFIRKKLANALIQFYEMQVEGVDFEEMVHKRVARKYNNFFSSFDQPEMRRLLEATDFDPALMLDQTIKDLQSSEHSSRAIQTLSKMKVIEERRKEVADAIAEVAKVDRLHSHGLDACFLKWATPENSYRYVILSSDKFGGDDWQNALRLALQGEGNESRMLVPVAIAMRDFFKHKHVYAILTESDSNSENLMLLMLESDNHAELQGACRVLSVVGTEKSLLPLKRLYDHARRKRISNVQDAAGMAGRLISKRTGAKLPSSRDARKADEE